jgi:hypothetical protein
MKKTRISKSISALLASDKLDEFKLTNEEMTFVRGGETDNTKPPPPPPTI